MPWELTDQLDEIDLKILYLLQRDGRMTNAELAKQVKLSPPSVHQRVRQLQHRKYIDGYTARLNAPRIGLSITVLAQVSLELHSDQPIERFRRAIDAIEEVVECFNVSGEYDFLLRIVVPTMQDYEELVRSKLTKLPGLKQLKSSFVLSTLKGFTGLPFGESTPEK